MLGTRRRYSPQSAASQVMTTRGQRPESPGRDTRNTASSTLGLGLLPLVAQSYFFVISPEGTHERSVPIPGWNDGSVGLEIADIGCGCIRRAGLVAMTASIGDQQVGPSGGMGSRLHQLFVSYSSRDKPVADAIVARLEQAGIRCWFAPRDVLPGMNWAQAIVDAIGSTRLMVVVLSGEANRSQQVLREVGRAISTGVVVIPFRIEAVEPTDAMAYYLASEHWLDALTPPLDDHIARLLQVVETFLDGASATGTAAAHRNTPIPDSPAGLLPPAPTIGCPPAREVRQRRVFATAGAVVAVLGILGAGILLSTRTADVPDAAQRAGLEDATREAAPATSPETATSDLASETSEPGITATIVVGDTPVGVVFGGGSVWVANRFDGTVSRIDPTSDAVTATIAVGSEPVAVAVGEGSVWVANSLDGTVSRIDPGTDAATATIKVGGQPFGVAVGEGSVWVTNFDDGTVSRIDPAAGTVTATIVVGSMPLGLAVGEGAVWATNLADGTVSRIDPGTDTITATIEVGDEPYGIAVGEGSVWVTAMGEGTVSRLDAASDTVTAIIDLGELPFAVAAVDGAIWVSIADGTVSRLDPAADAVTATIIVGDMPFGIAVGEGAVWVANSGDGTVSRINPGLDLQASPTLQRLSRLKAGDCLVAPPSHIEEAGTFWVTMPYWPDPVHVVPCSQPHSAEVLFVGDIWDEDEANPGQEAIDAATAARCEFEFEAYVGVPWATSILDYQTWNVWAPDWDRGDRQIGCVAFVHGGNDLEASIRGSAR